MDQILWFVLCLLFAYSCGSFPTGFLVAERRGIDIQKTGSGSTGATNVGRALGLKWAISVFALDVIKGGLPVFLGTLVLNLNWMIFAIAVSAILGHVFPYQLGFKGGKGVTCLIGILLVLLWSNPQYLGILAGIWILGFVSFKLSLKHSQWMAESNLLVILVVPVIFWINYHSLSWVLFGVVLAGIIYFTHRENIKKTG